MKKITKDGLIYREGGKTIVRALDSESSLAYGAICVNPEVALAKRVYEKTFIKKRIYMADEYDVFSKDHLSLQDNFVLTMNGYSSLSKEDCVRYGIKPGQYEAACEAILKRAIKYLQTKFEGARLQLSYGASNMGVDMAIEKVARHFNMDIFGFSCPRYMLYVEDNNIPVFVAKNAEDYADFYIRSSDLLITTGGREQALKHDIMSTCLYGKRVHFLDVLNMLSTTGGVPATIKDKNGLMKVDNAAAAFGRNISFYNRENANIVTDCDKWESVFNNINWVAADVCRSKMSPERMFG